MPRFRTAGPQDAGAIVALVNRAYCGPEADLGWTPETSLDLGARTNLTEIGEILADPNQCILMCFDPDLIGTVQVTRGGYLGMLSVDPRRQAGGIGRALLMEAERQAMAWRCPTLTLTVIDVQRDLTAYYERRGFVRTGRCLPFPFDPSSEIQRSDLALIELGKTL